MDSELKIERASKQLVRPAAVAAPAGADVEWVALSSADLMMPALHVDLLLAYEGAPADMEEELEKALAKVLCAYPEWAGRMEQAHAAAGRPAIVLNHAGAAFVQARAHAPLHYLLPFFHHTPSPLLLDLLPPSYVGAQELLLVQVTRFTCGGITIGVAAHHQVADGEAISDFLHAWALTAKGLNFPFSSSKDRRLLMARDPPQPIYDHDELRNKFFKSVSLQKHEVVVRKLYFSADSLQAIREEARKGGKEDPYTRFESLLGHLWRCITKARGLEDDGKDNNEEGGEKMTRLLVSVNARKRMNPKIENGYFGNVGCQACARSNISKLIREPLGYAATLVKDAIKKVDDEYVRSSFDYVELRERNVFEGSWPKRPGLIPDLGATSWATMPLYNLDFGSGCPLYGGNAFKQFEGLLLILPPPPPLDGGLYVVLSLFDSAMKNFLSLYDSIL